MQIITAFRIKFGRVNCFLQNFHNFLEKYFVSDCSCLHDFLFDCCNFLPPVFQSHKAIILKKFLSFVSVFEILSLILSKSFEDLFKDGFFIIGQ